MAAWPRRNAYLVVCQIAYYYLRGFRRFQVPNIDEGRVIIGYETNLGDLRFRNEDIRNRYKTELGRYLKMDLHPLVEKTSWGLDSVRKGSIGQIALDHAIRHVDMDRLKMEFLEQMLCFGTVGLATWKRKDAIDGLVTEMEVIPPWELFPIPAYPSTESDVQVIGRYRKVPVKWLQDKRKQNSEDVNGLNIPKDLMKADGGRARYDIEDVPFGSEPTDSNLIDDATLSSFSGEPGYGDTAVGVKGGKGKETRSEYYVPLTEAWVVGAQNTVARYVVKVGKEVVFDHDYSEDKVKIPMPVAICRHTPDMGFYSQGFVPMLLSGNHQMEKMLQNLYRNVEELDQYGTVMWPATAGAGLKEFTRKNGRPKIVRFEPDYSTPELKPFNLQPSNTGDFPGRVAMMGSEFQDKLSNQGPMFSGQPVGRIDSGAGLGFTFEVSQISQAATAHQVANCWSQVYRNVLATSRAELTEGGFLRITNVDDNIAGVVIDEEGRAYLNKNPLPNYWEVKIDIRDRQPKSVEARKQELIQMLQMGIVDDVEFRLINYREDLGFMVGHREEFEAYRKAVYHNIKLFNDGKTPGDIQPNIMFDNPEIHLRAVTGFVSRLEFSFASVAVREAFQKLTDLLRGMLAEYPAQAPDMMAAMGQQGGALMPPGAPPGGPPMPAQGPPI